MELTWYGLSCFRITERKHATVVTDPFRASVDLTLPKLKADIVTVSHDAKGHNNVPAVGGQFQTLTGPGEYEIGNVFVTGIMTPQEAQTTQNVVYMFDFDGFKVAHLGDMQKVPTQSQIEALEQVNILLVPVGGGNSLNASQAAEVVSMIEPNLVVPMHFSMPGVKFQLEAVDRFLNEMGVTEPTEESSLKISMSGLPEETETVLLKAKA